MPPTPPDRESVPKLAPGCDVTRLPIGAREGFVLSRVDGVMTLEHIFDIAGMPRFETLRILASLLRANAIRMA